MSHPLYTLTPRQARINASVSKAALKSAEYQDKVAFIEAQEQKRKRLLKACSFTTLGTDCGSQLVHRGIKFVSDDNVDS